MNKEDINPRHNRCVGESGELCFVLPEYYTTQKSICQDLFEKKFNFLKKLFRLRCTTKMSIEKSTKKEDYNCPHFLRLMLFDKFFCRFSSLLDIYKSTFLRYNITRRWAIARRVPSFAHRGSVSVKCQSHDIPLSRNGQRCAFLIFRIPKN